MSDYDRRRLRYEHQAQQMMRGDQGRLSEAASCLGCLLKVALGGLLIIAAIAGVFFLYLHFVRHVR